MSSPTGRLTLGGVLGLFAIACGGSEPSSTKTPSGTDGTSCATPAGLGGMSGVGGIPGGTGGSPGDVEGGIGGNGGIVGGVDGSVVDASLLLPTAADAGGGTEVETSGPLLIFSDSGLSSGFGMGVNSSGSRTDWLTLQDGFMSMAYPSGQAWGAVFISVFGDPVAPPRPKLDVSTFATLSVELRGQQGGESVSIGMKDNLDLDNGTETKVSVVVTPDWKEYRYPLSTFTTADLKSIYIITEFVFADDTAQTVDFRNLKLLP